VKQTSRMSCQPLNLELAPCIGRRRPCGAANAFLCFLGRDHFSLIKVMFGADYVHISRLWKSWLLHQLLQCYPPTSIF
jgi:hypothetical protein